MAEGIYAVRAISSWVRETQKFLEEETLAQIFLKSRIKILVEYFCWNKFLKKIWMQKFREKIYCWKFLRGKKFLSIKFLRKKILDSKRSAQI